MMAINAPSIPVLPVLIVPVSAGSAPRPMSKSVGASLAPGSGRTLTYQAAIDATINAGSKSFVMSDGNAQDRAKIAGMLP